MVIKPINTAAISDAAIASAATDTGVGALYDEIIVGITPEGAAHASYVKLTEPVTEYISLSDPMNGTALGLRGQAIATQSFRSIRAYSFLHPKRISATMDIVRERWGDLNPVLDGTIVDAETGKETMAILNRFPGLLEANPRLPEEELVILRAGLGSLDR